MEGGKKSMMRAVHLLKKQTASPVSKESRWSQDCKEIDLTLEKETSDNSLDANWTGQQRGYWEAVPESHLSSEGP